MAEQTDEQARLSELICVCTSNHDPQTRVECRYADQAAKKVVAAGWRPLKADGESPCWVTGCWRPQSVVLGNGLAVCAEHGASTPFPPAPPNEEAGRG